MNHRSLQIALAHLAWVAVGLFWFVVTRDHHPTQQLAIIVTASLVVAFALAVDANHFLLIPRYRRTRKFGMYILTLFGTMSILTAVALSVIRISYLNLLGPDPDPYGVYKHFAIDIFGMAVHITLAAGVVWAWGRITRSRDPRMATTQSA